MQQRIDGRRFFIGYHGEGPTGQKSTEVRPYSRIVKEDILPYYLAIGVDYDFFMGACPEELKPFAAAHNLKRKTQDEQMWFMGIYIQNAVAVAIEHNLAGKKARSEYFKEPLLQKWESREEPLTEAERMQQTEQFFLKLKIMQSNFDRK